MINPELNLLNQDWKEREKNTCKWILESDAKDINKSLVRIYLRSLEE